MKIFITGGTGFVGRYVAENFLRMGHEVTVVTRSASSHQGFPEGLSLLEADPGKPGTWQEQVQKHDTIINLAGSSIFTIWTARARERIMKSRTDTTRNLVDALSGCPGGTVLLSASAVGYYGSSMDDRMLDESSSSGNDFLAQVAKNWETEAKRASEFGVRVVLCRFGIVMGKGGGALGKMLPAFKYCLASPLGIGDQWFSWIHQEDLLEIMLFAREREDLSGPINCTAPHPVQNKEMTRILASVLHRPVILPSVPSFVLKALLGEFGSMLLKGQRVVPRRLLDLGYRFHFPGFRSAMEDILH